MKCSNLDISKPLKLVGGKWKIAIIYVLSKGPIRFGEIKRMLTPITQQMLTKQLREMEKDSLINRKVYDVVPPKVEYSLTDFEDLLNRYSLSYANGIVIIRIKCIYY